jgi:hypothetical protein
MDCETIRHVEKEQSDDTLPGKETIETVRTGRPEGTPRDIAEPDGYEKEGN